MPALSAVKVIGLVTTPLGAEQIVGVRLRAVTLVDVGVGCVHDIVPVGGVVGFQVTGFRLTVKKPC